MVGGKGDDRGWDGWMASLIQWIWVWVSSGSQWWTGKPGMLQSMGSQTVRHDWSIELNWLIREVWIEQCEQNQNSRDWGVMGMRENVVRTSFIGSVKWRPMWTLLTSFYSCLLNCRGLASELRCLISGSIQITNCSSLYSALMIKNIVGTSLVIQWLQLRTPNARDLGLIPARGIRSQMSQVRVCVLQQYPAQPNK